MQSNVQRGWEKTNIYLRILNELHLASHIDGFARSLDQRRDRFLQPNLPADEEKRETELIFRSFYSAVMTQQNRNWTQKKAAVLLHLPPTPDAFYSVLCDKSDDEIRELCARKLPKAAWVARYKRIRTIASRFIELERNYGGVRRYFRDVYVSRGAEQGLVNVVVRDPRLPGIGPITALNTLRDAFGMDLVKPDVVVRRIFYNLGWVQKEEKNPETFLQICREIGIHRPAVVDHVFWIFGNANGKPAWNIPQHCSGARDQAYAGCRAQCLCKEYGPESQMLE